MSKKEVTKPDLKQKCFHEHYFTENLTGIEDWVITSIDREDTLKKLRKRVYKLKTYAPCSLNEREIYEVFSNKIEYLACMKQKPLHLPKLLENFKGFFH